MTTPIRYQPVGPITSGSEVVLAAVINRVMYVATYDSTAVPVSGALVAENLVFYPFVVGGGTNTVNQIFSNNLLTLSVNRGRDNFITMQGSSSSTATGLWFSIASTFVPTNGNLFLRYILGREEMLLTPVTDYSEPPDPYVVFSGASYKFLGPRSQTVPGSVVYRPATSPQNLAVDTPIYIIPTVYHVHTTHNMSTAVCSSPIHDPITALKIFYCSNCSDYSTGCGGAICTNIPKTGVWTRSEDCTRSINYDYCKKGETCGSCFGPCDLADSTCDYNTPGGQASVNGNTNPFRCTRDFIQLSPGTDIPFYRQTWFIVLIVIIVVIALIIVFYMYLGRRRTTPSSSPTNTSYSSSSSLPNTANTSYSSNTFSPTNTSYSSSSPTLTTANTFSPNNTSYSSSSPTLTTANTSYSPTTFSPTNTSYSPTS
jgi:hypothetical protein